MVAGLLLAGAVLTQVTGIAALLAASDRRPLLLMAASFAAIGASVALMALALDRGLSLAVGYGTWSGAGIALTALGGAFLFGDRLTRRQQLGLVVVLVGVVLVRAAG